MADISKGFCVATRFLEGMGGDAGGVLRTADNRRRADGLLPLPEQKHRVSLIYPESILGSVLSTRLFAPTEAADGSMFRAGPGFVVA